jgi:hypothetical protein
MYEHPMCDTRRPVGADDRLGCPTEMQVLGKRHERSKLGQIKLPDHEHTLHAGSSTPVKDEQLSSSS